MNAVVDEDLPRSFAHLLTEKGFTVYDIRDVGLRGADDDAVFRFAQEKHAALFTADLGFSRLVSSAFEASFGVVILRFPNEMSTTSMNHHVGDLLHALSPKDYPGSLIVLSPGKIRIRRLQHGAKPPGHRRRF